MNKFEKYLQDGAAACRSFHSTGGFNAIIKLLSHSSTRAAAIELLETLTVVDPTEGVTAILSKSHEKKFVFPIDIF